MPPGADRSSILSGSCVPAASSCQRLSSHRQHSLPGRHIEGRTLDARTPLRRGCTGRTAVEFGTLIRTRGVASMTPDSMAKLQRPDHRRHRLLRQGLREDRARRAIPDIKRLVIFSRDELKQYEMAQEFACATIQACATSSATCATSSGCAGPSRASTPSSTPRRSSRCRPPSTTRSSPSRPTSSAPRT